MSNEILLKVDDVKVHYLDIDTMMAASRCHVGKDYSPTPSLNLLL